MKSERIYKYRRAINLQRDVHREQLNKLYMYWGCALLILSTRETRDKERRHNEVKEIFSTSQQQEMSLTLCRRLSLYVMTKKKKKKEKTSKKKNGR